MESVKIEIDHATQHVGQDGEGEFSADIKA